MKLPFVNSICFQGQRKKNHNGMSSVRNLRPIKEHFTKAFLQTSGLDGIWLVYTRKWDEVSNSFSDRM